MFLVWGGGGRDLRNSDSGPGSSIEILEVCAEPHDMDLDGVKIIRLLALCRARRWSNVFGGSV
jgi:hypothetical protein